jgi:hypothetical protein
MNTHFYDRCDVARAGLPGLSCGSDGQGDECNKALLFVFINTGTFSQIYGLFLYFIGAQLFYSSVHDESNDATNLQGKGVREEAVGKACIQTRLPTGSQERWKAR